MAGGGVVLAAQLVYPLEMGLRAEELCKVLGVRHVRGEQSALLPLGQVPVVSNLWWETGYIL